MHGFCLSGAPYVTQQYIVGLKCRLCGKFVDVDSAVVSKTDIPVTQNISNLDTENYKMYHLVQQMGMLNEYKFNLKQMGNVKYIVTFLPEIFLCYKLAI